MGIRWIIVIEFLCIAIYLLLTSNTTKEYYDAECTEYLGSRQATEEEKRFSKWFSFEMTIIALLIAIL